MHMYMPYNLDYLLLLLNFLDLDSELQQLFFTHYYYSAFVPPSVS